MFVLDYFRHFTITRRQGRSYCWLYIIPPLGEDHLKVTFIHESLEWLLHLLHFCKRKKNIKSKVAVKKLKKLTRCIKNLKAYKYRWNRAKKSLTHTWRLADAGTGGNIFLCEILCRPVCDATFSVQTKFPLNGWLCLLTQLLEIKCLLNRRVVGTFCCLI